MNMIRKITAISIGGPLWVLAITGCVSNSEVRTFARLEQRPDSAPLVYGSYRNVTRPFAVLYGDTKGRWLDEHESVSFTGRERRKNMRSWIVERAGFASLDARNQQLYLKTIFTIANPGDAEQSGQIAALVLIYKNRLGGEKLYSYMMTQNRESIENFALHLGRTSDRFYKNVSHYCK